MKIYAVKTGQTIIEQQSRVDLAAGAPLTDLGVEVITDLAGELSGEHIAGVYSSSDQAEEQTAKILSKRLGVKSRFIEDLREIDYGLWQGMTHDEISHQTVKLYRQWRESPSSVRPPNGEMLEEVLLRVRKALKTITKKHKDENVIVVLRPVTLGVFRCILHECDIDNLWQHVDEQFTWASYETTHERL